MRRTALITSILLAAAILLRCASAAGQAVPLRGMLATWNERMKRQGSHAMAGAPEQAWFTSADVVRMKNAGANCLEIHQVGLPDLMPTRGIPNERFFADFVDHWVDWCAQNEMYCILTITGMDGRSDWAFYLSMPPWLWEGLYDGAEEPSVENKRASDSVVRDFFDLDVRNQDANRAAFAALWKYIAARYTDNPYVLFGIMNEPLCLVEIPDQATARHLSRSYSSFMEQVSDAIRSVGATQAVLVDFPFLFDSEGQYILDPINRDGVVWETHPYVSPLWSVRTLDGWKATVDADVRRIVDGFHKPLFIGEYGISPLTTIRTTYAASWKAILSEMVAWMDTRPLFGRQFPSWDDMYGEYAGFAGDTDLSVEESAWIMDTVLPGRRMALQ